MMSQLPCTVCLSTLFLDLVNADLQDLRLSELV